MELHKNKFNEGDIVFEITRPHHLMLITKRDGMLYYCQTVANRSDPLAAFMERDLKVSIKLPETIVIEDQRTA